MAWGGGGVIEVRNGALRDLHAPKNGKIEGWDSVARHPPDKCIRRNPRACVLSGQVRWGGNINALTVRLPHFVFCL